MTNKQLIIFSVSVVVAAGAGFAGGYFFGRHKMKKECDSLINQMNDEINDYVEQITSVNTFNKTEGMEETDYTNNEAYLKAKELAKKNEELKKEYWERIHKEGYAPSDKEIEPKVDGYEPENSPITEEFKEQVRKEVAEMSDEEYEAEMLRDYDNEERIRQNKENNLETDEHYEERMADTRDIVAESAMQSSLPPYIIDQDDYESSQFDGFTKQQFTYFGDGTLLDENDDIIPNPEDVVGLDNLVELEGHPDGQIFVRNEAFAADYEIIFKEMSYQEWAGDSFE